jgi:hypothetical protein
VSTSRSEFWLDFFEELFRFFFFESEAFGRAKTANGFVHAGTAGALVELVGSMGFRGEVCVQFSASDPRLRSFLAEIKSSSAEHTLLPISDSTLSYSLTYFSSGDKDTE